jgi:hypothetical protein
MKVVYTDAALFPSPLEGEGRECKATAKHEPGEGSGLNF